MLQDNSFESSGILSPNQENTDSSIQIMINLNTSKNKKVKSKISRKTVRFSENIEVHFIESNQCEIQEQVQDSHYDRMKEQIAKIEVHKISNHLNNLLAQHNEKLQPNYKNKQTGITPELSQNLCKCLIF